MHTHSRTHTHTRSTLQMSILLFYLAIMRGAPFGMHLPLESHDLVTDARHYCGVLIGLRVLSWGAGVVGASCYCVPRGRTNCWRWSWCWKPGKHQRGNASSGEFSSAPARAAPTQLAPPRCAHRASQGTGVAMDIRQQWSRKVTWYVRTTT